MKKYRVAIIGCGDMGRQHASAWRLREDATIVAVYDILPGRAEALAKETGAVACGSRDEALLMANFVSVCTPINTHAQIAIAAMKKKCHVLGEKAMAFSEAEAKAMIATARKTGVVLGTSHQYRGCPKFQRFRALIREGALGKGPLFVRFTDAREVRPKLAMHDKAQNGGPIVDMCGHYFDLMRFYTGEEAASVYACGHVFGKGKEKLKSIPPSQLAYDAAEITVTYTGGHILSIFANWGMPEKHPGSAVEEIWGPEGMARSIGDQVEVVYADRTIRYAAKGNPVGPAVRIADLIDTIEGRKDKPEIAGEDGLAALRVCLAAIKSIETGKVTRVRSAIVFLPDIVTSSGKPPRHGVRTCSPHQ